MFPQHAILLDLLTDPKVGLNIDMHKTHGFWNNRDAPSSEEVIESAKSRLRQSLAACLASDRSPFSKASESDESALY